MRNIFVATILILSGVFTEASTAQDYDKLIGSMFSEAVNTLKSTNVEANIVRHDKESLKKAGTVLRITESENQIDIHVAAERFEVPPIIEIHFLKAIAILVENGFTFEVAFESQRCVPENYVFDSLPKPGEVVFEKNSKVILTVNNGAPGIIPERIIGSKTTEADGILADLGLSANHDTEIMDTPTCHCKGGRPEKSTVRDTISRVHPLPGTNVACSGEPIVTYRIVDISKWQCPPVTIDERGKWTCN